MENATKALEMAAGVLITLMIIGVCVYAYNNLVEQKNIEQSSIRDQQATDFNKSFEVYNQDSLYGSEVLSLANKVVDYNEKEANQKGYEEIEIEVNLRSTLPPSFNRTKYTAEQLTDDYKELSRNIEDKGKVTKNGKTVAQWAKLSKNAVPDDTRNLVDEYKDLLNDQTDIARKTFNCTSVEYDNTTGRIKKMFFSEV